MTNLRKDIAEQDTHPSKALDSMRNRRIGG